MPTQVSAQVAPWAELDRQILLRLAHGLLDILLGILLVPIFISFSSDMTLFIFDSSWGKKYDLQQFWKSHGNHFYDDQ